MSFVILICLFLMNTEFPLLAYCQNYIMWLQAYILSHETLIQLSVHAYWGIFFLKLK